MPVVKSHVDVLKDIKAKTFKPVYLLHGVESYFIDVLAKAFEEQAIDPAARSFNQQVLYGRDVTPSQLIDAASRYPMMAPHQLVLVREAQYLENIDDLLRYVKQPVPTTIFVLAYRGKKLNGKTKLYKALVHYGSVFESLPLYSNKIPAFVKADLKFRKRTAEPGVAELLAEYLGTDLGVLSGALDKLVINVPGDETITPQHVETHVGISRQFNIFELQDALGAKDLERAVHIGFALSQNERNSPLVLTIGSLYGFYAAMFAVQDVMHLDDATQKNATGVYNAFRLGKIRQAARAWPRAQLMEALEILADFDLRSKGVNYNLGSGVAGELTLELVERLVGLATQQAQPA